MDRAIILAAGLGTRLKWLTHGRPKALMQVAGVPAIVHVIRRLAGQGIRDIAINAHHHAGQLADYLGDGSRFGVDIRISHETRLLDSGGGVKQALSLLPGEGAVVVHNADVMADIDLQALAASCPAGGGCLSLVANPVHHPQGDFALQGGRISLAEGVRYTFAGVSMWDPQVFEAETEAVFPLSQSMRRLIEAGQLAGVLHRGQWFDIGRPRDLLLAGRHWQS